MLSRPRSGEAQSCLLCDTVDSSASTRPATNKIVPSEPCTGDGRHVSVYELDR
jgi:hypothetical protein